MAFIYSAGILIQRLFLIFFILLKYSVKRSYTQRGKTLRLDNPTRLKLLFEDIGGVFIKFGQILAMRFDLIPVRYATALMDLLDDALYVPDAEMFQVFEKDRGKSIYESFDSIEETPVATASFAQVYRGIYQGNSVAIKIQKPNAGKYIDIDLKILYFFAYIIDALGFITAVSAKETIDQLKLWTNDELDYTTEAHNTKIIYDHIKKHHLDDVIVPFVYDEFISQKVLVLEFLNGIQVKQFLNLLKEDPVKAENLLQKHNIDLKTVAEFFVSDLLRQYSIDYFFHADPHPGNLMLFPNNKIGYLDFGIIGRPITNNYGLLCMIEGMTRKDPQSAATGIMDFANQRLQEDLEDILESDPIIKKKYDKVMAYITKRVGEDLKPIVDSWYISSGDQTLNPKERSSAITFFKIIKVLEKYYAKFPTDVIAFIRALLIIDMVCLMLIKEFDMVRATRLFFQNTPLEKIEELVPIHKKDLVDLKKFKFLRLKEKIKSRTFTNEKTLHAAENYKERQSIIKENLLNMISNLVERYPELYNEIK